MPAPKCAVCVHFQLYPEHFERFFAAVMLQAKNSKELEPWCHQFDVCRLPEQPYSILLYETYDDREAFARHRQTEHFAQFQRAIEGCVASKDVGVWDIQS